MLQRAFFLLHGQLDLDQLFRLSEHAFITSLQQSAGESPAGELLAGLFGPTRRLYKRLAEFSYFQERRWYEKVARQPYSWLTACSEAFAAAASKRLGRRIPPHEILFDAPPVKREVEFNVQIHFPKEKCYRPLGEVSPVVHTLATKQFDDYVKRVRIFVHPRIAAEMRSVPRMDEILAETLLTMG